MSLENQRGAVHGKEGNVCNFRSNPPRNLRFLIENIDKNMRISFNFQRTDRRCFAQTKPYFKSLASAGCTEAYPKGLEPATTTRPSQSLITKPADAYPANETEPSKFSL